MWSQFLLITLFSTFLAYSVAPADVARIHLQSIFSDGMILQRNHKNYIRGWATPNTIVTGRIGPYGASTRSNIDGSFILALPEMPSGGPYTLVVKAFDQLVVSNILIGEVWLCCGQSNMALEMSQCHPGVEELSHADSPELRFFDVVEATSPSTKKDIRGHWIASTRTNLPRLSACAFYFSRRLHSEVKVPVGVVTCCARGMPLKSWLCPQLANGWKDARPFNPSGVFNAMLAPLVGFGIRGIIWYQGEADLFSARAYEKMLPKIFADLRARWGEPILPVLVVQLPNFSVKDDTPADSIWSDFREAQDRAVYLMKHTYLTVSIDSCPEESVDLHPPEKIVIGQRLAAAATQLTNGQLPFVSPRCSRVEIKEDKVVVTFECEDRKLYCRGEKLQGFALAGPDGRFVWADAKIVSRGNIVNVSSRRVKKVAAIRYAWGDNPRCNLYSAKGLPAIPFRVENFSDASKLKRNYHKFDLLQAARG